MMMRRWLMAGVAMALLWACHVAGAQVPPSAEFRADVMGAAPYTFQLGGGVNLAAGYYQRVELDVGAGALRRDGVLKGAGRVDALMRLLLDPFGQRRWAMSLAGGVSARYEPGDKVRPYLVGLLDFEGPPAHGIRMAYQVGFGGGVRIGVVIRRVRTNWR